MRTLFILRGLPASGKSSFAADLVKKECNRWVRINRDDLRGMCVGPGNNPHGLTRDREDLVRSFKEDLTRRALADGYDVVLDDTHLVPTTVKKLHALAKSVGDVKVIERCFNISIDECIARDSKRTGFAHVGEKVIRDMARGAGLDKGRTLVDKETYYEPQNQPCEPIVQDESLPKAIMCDLDGTLAIIGNRSPYDASDCDVKDFPNWPVIRTVLAMHAHGARVIFMSGRDQKYRPETVRFIEKYCQVRAGVPEGNRDGDTLLDVDGAFKLKCIPYELHMRGETAPDPNKADMRKDAIIKGELFDKYVRGKFNVLFVLDDRNSVCDFWRSIGLTCFQVNYGDF